MRITLYLILSTIPIWSAAQTAEASLIAAAKKVLEVKKDFEAYRLASLEDRGDEAVGYLDARVLDYYDAMLMHARYSDSAKVADLLLIDQAVVLGIRHRATAEQIKSFTDTTCLVFALDEGMIDKEGVARIQIDAIEIEGDFARATVSSQGEVAPVKFHFYRDGGIWKFDMTQIFPTANLVFNQIQTDSGMEAGEFMIFLLEIASGTPIDEETIWQPIIK
ncbi:MAG: hypothetical protein AAF741_16345 [Bacteroidota bacterium]